jgi:hypothetical protein
VQYFRSVLRFETHRPQPAVNSGSVADAAKTCWCPSICCTSQSFLPSFLDTTWATDCNMSSGSDDKQSTAVTQPPEYHAPSQYVATVQPAVATKITPAEILQEIIRSIRSQLNVNDEVAEYVAEQFNFTEIDLDNCRHLASPYDQLEFLLPLLVNHLQPGRQGNDLPDRVNLVYDPSIKKWYQLDVRRGIYLIRDTSDVVDSVRLVFGVYYSVGKLTGSFSEMEDVEHDADEEEGGQQANAPDVEKASNEAYKKVTTGAKRFVEYMKQHRVLDYDDFAALCDKEPYAMSFSNGELSIGPAGNLVIRIFPKDPPLYRWTKHNGVKLQPDMLTSPDADHFKPFNRYFIDSFGQHADAAKFVMGSCVSGDLSTPFVILLMSGATGAGKSTFMAFIICLSRTEKVPADAH